MYHGPYEVVSVMVTDIQVRDLIRCLRVIHLNNCMIQRRSGVVELPYADVTDGQPNESVETVIQIDTAAEQTSTGFDMVTGSNSRE